MTDLHRPTNSLPDGRRAVALRPDWARLAGLSLALSISAGFWWRVLHFLAA
ncbi:MAG: hypothetical protein JWP49_2774 [Phenylobacterium sp.]|nr:hypothetical protein [Phenylobacterium sp.]